MLYIIISVNHFFRISIKVKLKESSTIKACVHLIDAVWMKDRNDKNIIIQGSVRAVGGSSAPNRCSADKRQE